jgi:hypothetical protein
MASGFPIPEGQTSSFSFPAAGVNTATFTLPGGAQAVVTFQPLDYNNPGTLTLSDSAGNTILTMLAGGYAGWTVPNIATGAGTGYYFNATAGAQLVAATVPNSLR